nr:MAG TPA: hypothetical protein [Caudoviricetes sp.]
MLYQRLCVVGKVFVCYKGQARGKNLFSVIGNCV